jgi:hypothetical protein
MVYVMVTKENEEGLWSWSSLQLHYSLKELGEQVQMWRRLFEASNDGTSVWNYSHKCWAIMSLMHFRVLNFMNIWDYKVNLRSSICELQIQNYLSFLTSTIHAWGIEDLLGLKTLKASQSLWIFLKKSCHIHPTKMLFIARIKSNW